jgi:hypothetical protein
MTDSIAIARITIQWEGKWHLQIYTYAEYDYEEQHSEYCETLQECCRKIGQFQKSVTR